MTISSNEFYRIVLADIEGRATPEETSALRVDEESVREWRDLLVKLLQELELEQLQIRTSLLSKQQECLAAGHRGKAAYFEYKLKCDEARATTVRRKAAVVEKLKESKAALHAFAGDQKDDLWNELRSLNEKIDRLTDLVLKLAQP